MLSLTLKRKTPAMLQTSGGMITNAIQERMMTVPIVGPRAKKQKPAKPRKDFPLYPHNSGQWAKKVRGKTHFFGKWDDPVAAETKWLRDCEALINGRDPDESRSGDTVGWLVNAFMDFKEDQVNRKDLTKNCYKDYLRCSKVVADFFGRGRSLESLRPGDFDRYRSSFPATWSPVMTNHHLRHVRAIFKWANDRELTERPIKYQSGLELASKDKIRKHLAGKEQKLFSAQEIHALLASATVPMKAAIMLGINCAYGLADCGQLEQSMIDLKKSWLGQHRNKTGIPREAWLWPETVQAIRAAIAVRPATTIERLDAYVFLTSHRRPWFEDGANSSPASIAFRKVKIAANCDRKGIGFYSLRHTFQTVAGDSVDQIAVNLIMGHHDPGMAANYRHGIDPARVKAVCQHVRKWWLAGKPKKAKNSG
jgi:integrase